MNPKVLVAAPTYQGMQYIQDEFIDKVKQLTFPSYDILIVDNSVTPDNYNYLSTIAGITVIHDTISDKDPKTRLIASRNYILEYARTNSYEYVLMLDSDVLIPSDIIERLLSHNKPLVSGLYFNLFNDPKGLKLLPICWKSFTPEEFKEIQSKVRFPPHITSHKDVRRHLTATEITSNTLQRVMHPSAGCMLIHKKVFRTTNYSPFHIPRAQSASSDDIYFIRSASEKGFKIYCDPSILCTHVVLKKYRKDREGNFVSGFDKSHRTDSIPLTTKDLRERLINNEFVHYLQYVQ